MLKIESKAPNFYCVNDKLNKVSLGDFDGFVKILISVPSVDSGICDAEIKKFSKELEKYSNIKIIVLSLDLPFAQKRWCGHNEVKNVIMLSDYQEKDFATKYDAFLDDIKLLKRAIFVVDKNNNITYLQYCKTKSHPDYKKALEAIEKLF